MIHHPYACYMDGARWCCLAGPACMQVFECDARAACKANLRWAALRTDAAAAARVACGQLASLQRALDCAGLSAGEPREHAANHPVLLGSSRLQAPGWKCFFVVGC